MTNDYDDIINLPHHVSCKHPPMPMIDRAAQFAPFAALTGFGAVIQESARLTDREIELEEYAQERLNRMMMVLMESVHNHPTITIVYFKPDERKVGGSYVSLTGQVKRIDEYNHQLVFVDGTKVSMTTIVNLQFVLESS